MHTAIRPYVTTGVALVGASVISAAPVMPITTASTAPDIQVPAVQTADVQLAATVGWQEFIDKTLTNLNTQIANIPVEYVVPGTDPQETAETPVPVVHQVGQNAITSATDIFEALFPPGGVSIESVIAGAVEFLAAANKPIQNIANTANVLLDPINVALVAAGLITPVFSGVAATIEAVEAIFDPPAGSSFFTELINLAPTMLDGVINGEYGELINIVIEIPNPVPILPDIPVDVVVTPGGILSPLELDIDIPNLMVTIGSPGPVSSGLFIRDEVAGAIGMEFPAVPPASVAADEDEGVVAAQTAAEADEDADAVAADEASDVEAEDLDADVAEEVEAEELDTDVAEEVEAEELDADADSDVEADDAGESTKPVKPLAAAAKKLGDTVAKIFGGGKGADSESDSDSDS